MPFADDQDSETPTTPIVARQGELHSGDNDVQMDLPQIADSPR